MGWVEGVGGQLRDNLGGEQRCSCWWQLPGWNHTLPSHPCNWRVLTVQKNLPLKRNWGSTLVRYKMRKWQSLANRDAAVGDKKQGEVAPCPTTSTLESHLVINFEEEKQNNTQIPFVCWGAAMDTCEECWIYTRPRSQNKWQNMPIFTVGALSRSWSIFRKQH